MIIQPIPPLSDSQTESLALATQDLRPERGFVMDVAVILAKETIYAQVSGLDDGILVNNVRVVK